MGNGFLLCPKSHAADFSLRETVFGPELSLEAAAAQVLRDVRGE